MRRTNRLLAAVSISALFAGALVISPMSALGEDTEPSSGPTDTQAPAAQSAPDVPEPTGGNLADCDIQGTAQNDTLKSNDRGQVICGMGGKDTIYGNGGPDEIRGGPGNDTLLGGGGDDDLLGGDNSDTCKQHKGNGKLDSCEWPSPIEACPYPQGTVYNGFGDPRPGDDHKGNDIIAPGNRKGDKVYATNPGKAIRWEDSGAGAMVSVVGPRGVSQYMHMLERGRASGKVKAGDVIGFVGSTGNAGSTNHVHYEWAWRGAGDNYWDWPESDPFPYLKKVCDRTAAGPEATAVFDPTMAPVLEAVPPE